MTPILPSQRCHPRNAIPSGISLRTWRWIGPVPASCILLAVFGLLYSSGVYISLIDDENLVKAFGVAFLSCDLGMAVFGYMLHAAHTPDDYTKAPRNLNIICALAISSQVLMVPALLHGNIILLYTSAALMGAGSGGAYIVAVAVLQSWVPESIGSITACGMVFAQFGSLGGTAAFRLASSFFGNPHTAMFVTSVLSGMLVASCTLLLSRPMHDWDPREEKCAAMMSDVSDATPLLFDAKCSDSEDSVNDASQSENTDKSSSQMSIFEVLRSWMFYPYMVMIAVELAPATGLMLVFPQMLNILFHIPLERANKIFLWVHVGGVCGRLIGGVAVDIIAHVIPDSTGLASTKIVNGAVLTLQSTMLVAMVVAVGQGNVVVFTIAAGFVYFCFCAGMVGSACHARSMYTGRNSTLVFALSGLLTGIATLLFSNMLAAASGTQMSPSSRANAHKIFMDFFTLSIKVSLVGLVCCLCTTVCKKAYDKANGQNSDLLRAEAC